MLSVLLSIIGILLTIFFVVGTHEYAHFIMARRLGVKVLCFSIGFGKALYRFRDRKQTEYIIAAIPLGGYVRMLDEHEGPVADHELKYAYNRQPFYKKFLIVLAGPLMNLFCAFVIYTAINLIGYTVVKPIIGEVTPASIAEASGLKSGDEIIAVDNHPINNWNNIILRILLHAGNQDILKLTVINAKKITPSTLMLDLKHFKLDELTPDIFSSLGMKPYDPPLPLIVGHIEKNSSAYQSPLKLKDKILSINHQPFETWPQLITYVENHPNLNVRFSVLREQKILNFDVQIGSHANLLTTTGHLGISPQFDKNLLRKIQYGPFQAMHHGLLSMWNFTYLNLVLSGKLILGKLSLDSLGGPITIFQTAGDAFKMGIFFFISFLAFLSISLGVVNLFPIPGLDGGHLLILTIEALIGRPISEKIVLNLYRIGFGFLIFLLSIGIINDLRRLL